MDSINGKVSNAKAAELYTSLHIDQSPKNPKFNGGNNDVYDAIYPEEYIDWTHFYDSMLTLNGGIDVLVYAGAFDQQDGPLTMPLWMKDLQVLQNNDNKFWKQARKIFYLQDGANNDTIGGYYRTDSRFTFLSVPKAGHFVPTTNMAATRQFLRDYISPARALGCWNADRNRINQCSTADIMCKYTKNATFGLECMGNGNCDSAITGQCTCFKGYRGADCSKQVTDLYDGLKLSIGFKGSQSFFMQYDSGVQSQVDFELTISNANPFDIYINAGLFTDPNEFESEIAVKGQTYVKISSRTFPSLKSSFVIRASVNGLVYSENAILDNILLVNFNKVGSSGV